MSAKNRNKSRTAEWGVKDITEEHYVIHLYRNESGCWGTVSSGAERTSFQGICGLWNLLSGPAEAWGELERLRTEVQTDPLTGLLNRRGVEHAVKSELRWCAEGEMTSVLFLDIDDLKRINDTWGHQRGDQVLQVVARTIRGCVREEDVVGRLSGDDFVVLLRGAGQEALRKKADQLCRAVSGASPETGLSISVGGACGGPGCTYEELLSKADQALYHVKRRGKNGCALYGEIC